MARTAQARPAASATGGTPGHGGGSGLGATGKGSGNLNVSVFETSSAIFLEVQYVLSGLRFSGLPIASQVFSEVQFADFAA